MKNQKANIHIHLNIITLYPIDIDKLNYKHKHYVRDNRISLKKNKIF